MKRLALLALLLFPTKSIAQVMVESRKAVETSLELANKIKINADTEFRHRVHDSSLSYQHVNFGADFKAPFSDKISLGIYYKHIFQDKGNWAIEYRPYTDLNIKQGLIGPLLLANRFRFESRAFEGSMAWRARDKVGLIFSTKPLDLYVSDELFFEANGLTRNRLESGFSIKWKHLSFRNFLMLQSSNLMRDVQNTIAIGTRLGTKF